jgi:hypothetical protein
MSKEVGKETSERFLQGISGELPVEEEASGEEPDSEDATRTPPPTLALPLPSAKLKKKRKSSIQVNLTCLFCNVRLSSLFVTSRISLPLSFTSLQVLGSQKSGESSRLE